MATTTRKRTTAKKVDRKAQDRSMQQRLQDHLKVFKKRQDAHANPRMLKEIAFYPAHDKRAETPEYKAVHKEMAITNDLPCLVCGVRNSTLKVTVKNPYGAKAMETHHHVIEWALANAIDVGKFNQIMLPHLRFRHPQNPDYQKEFTADDVAAWVDHSRDNLWVLCDVHHRATYFGIHEITYPIWGPQDLLRDDFEAYVREQLRAEKAKAKPKAKRTAKKKAA